MMKAHSLNLKSYNMDQMFKVLKQYSVFGGLFDATKQFSLPEKHKSFPVAYMVNIRRSSSERNHWIVIYLQGNGYGEYFDANGKRPPNKSVQDYVNRHCYRGVRYTKYVHNVLWSSCFHCMGYIEEKASHLYDNLF